MNIVTSSGEPLSTYSIPGEGHQYRVNFSGSFTSRRASQSRLRIRCHLWSLRLELGLLMSVVGVERSRWLLSDEPEAPAI